MWSFARRDDAHLHKCTRLCGVHEALESALKGATGVHLMGDRLGKRSSYWQHQRLTLSALVIVIEGVVVVFQDCNKKYDHQECKTEVVTPNG